MKISILKQFTLLSAMVIGATLISAFTGNSNHIRDSRPVDGEKGFALVELFTSEGCSTCPPADELIAKIQKEQGTDRVFVLAYHVDYWNNAGWKDQFSSSLFTKRQLKYAEQLKLAEGPYTPQMVINGTREMVGSDEKVVRAALDDALGNVVDTKLTLKDPVVKNGNVTLTYQTHGALTNVSLQLALVQKKAVTKVLRGENKGRTLSHIQIVRSLQDIDLKGAGSGTAQIQLDPALSAEDFEVIGFLQDKNVGKIITAAKLPLPKK